VRVIDLAPTESGRIRRTLVPFPNFQIGGQVLPPIADYFINDRLGSTRRIGRLSRYQHVPTAEEGIGVKSAVNFSLYHPDDSELLDHAIFLHDLRP
jgi:hypothetical protein